MPDLGNKQQETIAKTEDELYLCIKLRLQFFNDLCYFEGRALKLISGAEWSH